MTMVDEKLLLHCPRIRRLLVVGLPFLCLVAAGCSRGNFGTVDGTVSLDGSTLDGGSLAFYPVIAGPVYYADVGPDGTYHLRTSSHDSVIPGAYVATISYRSGRPSPSMSIREIEALEKVPIRYCTKETSDLRIEVKPGSNSIDLKMITKN